MDIKSTEYYINSAISHKTTDDAKIRGYAIYSRLNEFIHPDTRITKSSNYSGLFILENPNLKLRRNLLLHINYNPIDGSIQVVPNPATENRRSIGLRLASKGIHHCPLTKTAESMISISQISKTFPRMKLTEFTKEKIGLEFLEWFESKVSAGEFSTAIFEIYKRTLN